MPGDGGSNRQQKETKRVLPAFLGKIHDKVADRKKKSRFARENGQAHDERGASGTFAHDEEKPQADQEIGKRFGGIKNKGGGLAKVEAKGETEPGRQFLLNEQPRE